MKFLLQKHLLIQTLKLNHRIFLLHLSAIFTSSVLLPIYILYNNLSLLLKLYQILIVKILILTYQYLKKQNPTLLLLLFLFQKQLTTLVIQKYYLQKGIYLKLKRIVCNSFKNISSFTFSIPIFSSLSKSNDNFTE